MSSLPSYIFNWNQNMSQLINVEIKDDSDDDDFDDKVDDVDRILMSLS